eukprot:maker-scaffold408_size180710-snap-gene-0.40 protein:Tk05209 transcript:maker-scaffold408_size180710-snap-gene-0.40-mRNA-1 annotation:"zinc finger cchc domain-containing protein 10"
MPLGLGGFLPKKSEPPTETIRCQKCLQFGHWTYECQNDRKYLHRDSRTVALKRKLKEVEQEEKRKLEINSLTDATGQKTKKKKKQKGR